MKISLKQYLFLLDQHVIYGLLNDLSTFKSKRDLWSEKAGNVREWRIMLKSLIATIALKSRGATIKVVLLSI